MVLMDVVIVMLRRTILGSRFCKALNKTFDYCLIYSGNMQIVLS